MVAHLPSHRDTVWNRSGGYVSAEMRAALLRYKYDGEDRSFLYRFVLQPMNAALIQFVPLWAAPNLLTTLGLSIVAVAFALTTYYSPNFDQPLPSWLYYFVGFALFAYQTIDNVRHKHKRR